MQTIVNIILQYAFLTLRNMQYSFNGKYSHGKYSVINQIDEKCTLIFSNTNWKKFTIFAQFQLFTSMLTVIDHICYSTSIELFSLCKACKVHCSSSSSSALNFLLYSTLLSLSKLPGQGYTR